MRTNRMRPARSAANPPVELGLAEIEKVGGGSPTLPLPPPRSGPTDPVPW